MLTALVAGRLFTKLDFAQPDQQLIVDEDAVDTQMTITQGVFRVKRHQFGIPFQWQFSSTSRKLCFPEFQALNHILATILIMGYASDKLAE